MAILDYLPGFHSGNAVSQIDDLPPRETGRGGPCSSRAGCICPDGLGLDELLLCGSLPDAAHRHRQFVARGIEGPWVGVDQAATRAALGNSGSAGCEVSRRALRSALAAIG